MATTQATPNLQPVDREKIYIWINELTNPETRESALFELRYSILKFILECHLEFFMFFNICGIQK